MLAQFFLKLSNILRNNSMGRVTACKQPVLMRHNNSTEECSNRCNSLLNSSPTKLPRFLNSSRMDNNLLLNNLY